MNNFPSNPNPTPEFTQATQMELEQQRQRLRRRNITIGVAGGVVVLLLCCCLAVIAFLYFDPFNLGLLSRLFGRYDAIAKATPPDSAFYGSVNLLNLTPDKLDPLINAFSDAFEQAGDTSVSGTADIYDEIDNALDDYNITVEEDIMPWIGQYAGFSIANIRFNDEYGYPEEMDVFFAVESRDRAAAEAFLEKLREGISDNNGSDWNENEYQGVTIYVEESDWSETAMAYVGSLVVIGSNEDAVRAAIDSQQGDSLADDPVFRQVVGRLPSERAVTFYISGSQLSEFYQAAAQSYAYGLSMNFNDLSAGVSGIAMSASIVGEGVQIDTITAYNPDQLSENQRLLLEATGRSGRASQMFPMDTLFFTSGQRLDLAWANYYEIINEATDGDFEQAIEEIENEIGINPNTDLFPYLDGEYAMAIFPSNDGIFAAEGVDIGFAFLAQVSDENAILNTVDDFTNFVEDQGGIEVNDASTGNLTIYELTDTYLEEPAFAYGAGNGWLALGSTADTITRLHNPDGSLSGNEGFRSVWNAFPGGTSPLLYIDVASLLDTIGNSLQYEYDQQAFEEIEPFFQPITYVAMGSTGYSNDAVQSTLIIFIPTP